MKLTRIEVSVSVAWWVHPYLSGVGLFADLTGMTPDYEKCVAFAMRGVRAKVTE